MITPTASIIGVVAAYKRPGHLRDLLSSITDAGAVSKVIVVDNGLDAETETVCRQSPVPVLYHRPEYNLGCGGGIGRGLQLGSRENGVTHFCLFDDDAQATPGSVASLVQGMREASADIAVPLIVNPEGHVSWFPGLIQGPQWKVIRQPGLTPAEYRRVCGLAPTPFSWSPWPVMALSAQVVRECGFPRHDFYLCSEDLEYSLRLTWRHKGVLVPAAVCRHIPPPSSGGNERGGPHYLRFCLMLQNNSFLSVWLPHGRRSLRHLPGNYMRFFRLFGLNRHTLRDALLAFRLGAVLGKPAGTHGCDRFKKRLLTRIGAPLEQDQPACR
jgi:GT2 family glycosyltransferase